MYNFFQVTNLFLI